AATTNVCTRDTVAKGSHDAASRKRAENGTILSRRAPRLPACRHDQLARRQGRFPPPCARNRVPAGGRLRPRRQPHVELRPLAARAPALPPKAAPLHGEERAVQSDSEADPPQRP